MLSGFVSVIQIIVAIVEFINEDNHTRLITYLPVSFNMNEICYLINK
jgi:hypothetical protein